MLIQINHQFIAHIKSKRSEFHFEYNGNIFKFYISDHKSLSCIKMVEKPNHPLYIVENFTLKGLETIYYNDGGSSLLEERTFKYSKMTYKDVH